MVFIKLGNVGYASIIALATSTLLTTVEGVVIAEGTSHPHPPPAEEVPSERFKGPHPVNTFIKKPDESVLRVTSNFEDNLFGEQEYVASLNKKARYEQVPPEQYHKTFSSGYLDEGYRKHGNLLLSKESEFPPPTKPKQEPKSLEIDDESTIANIRARLRDRKLDPLERAKLQHTLQKYVKNLPRRAKGEAGKRKHRSRQEAASSAQAPGIDKE